MFAKKIIILSVSVLLLFTACRPTFSPSPTPFLTSTILPTLSPTSTMTVSLVPTEMPAATSIATQTPLPTATFTPSATASKTASPTPIDTSTPSASPTYEDPDVTVQMQANCRYGPGTAYLYSHGLYEGDHAAVHGRNYSGTWLWIKPDNLNRHCWVSEAVVEVEGDVMVLKVVTTQLPVPGVALYGAPDNVRAERDGDKVIISWDRVNMTEDDDRGYLIEANVCQNGSLVWMAVRTDDTILELKDETTCSADSSGLLYTVEKHGYPAPVQIPWP